ncbi:SH3 domain-containing protein [Azospirillum sp. TSO35-2]|uniref:SH3 domain-containing protein n=1 Tax=Azospirillum sp. TSO35-2 TaxID=716796 RepID=UPI000D62115C|nr:SH3 domain-containing protein [Azospirillum sp. TSO35-2]PWC31248.1 hypothetical protein TSO352_31135 [Azospirillum sp. TSO35-2]
MSSLPNHRLLSRLRAPVPMAASAALAVALLAATVAVAQTGAPARIEPLDADFVAASRTNIRQQPSLKGARVAQIDAGAKVHVTGKVADAPWYLVVREDGKTGFVAVEQLRALPAPPPAPPAVAAAPSAVPEIDGALRERLDRIEATLKALEQRLPAAKDVEALSATTRALIEREEKRAAAPAPAMPTEPGLLDAMGKLQDQVAAQLREQRAEFSRLSDQIGSVESSVQPLIDWSKRWTSAAEPAAENARGWVSSTYSTVRDWTLGWVPWWNAAPQPAPAPAAAPPKDGPRV